MNDVIETEYCTFPNCDSDMRESMCPNSHRKLCVNHCDDSDHGENKMITDKKIRAAIKVECDRQHVGEDRQVMLYGAYSFLQEKTQVEYVLNAAILQSLACIIEPSNNGQFRTTPVYFEHSITAAIPADNVPRAMATWITFFNGELARLTGDFEIFADALIKEFLDIHPFTDGNGRTAWLLRVWLLNQWDDPQPLPNYYGE